jgi:hypothetical protein
MRREREWAYKPLLAVTRRSIRGSQLNLSELVVRNIGTGPALNVRLSCQRAISSRATLPSTYGYLKNAMELARATRVALPAAAQVEQFMRAMDAAGHGDYDHSGLVTVLEELAGFVVASYGEAD